VRLSLLEISFCLLTGFRRCFALLWRRQLHAGPAGLRETDCYRLFCRPRPVLALPDMVDFLPNEFSSLRGGRLTFAFVTTRTL
jgi:hypothetical protein